jgi:polar amino acid transport system substrate-binding protein
MKGFVVIIAASIVCVAFAAWVATASGGRNTPAAPSAAEAKLPPLPAAVKNRKRWIMGIKCDTWPFGYIGVKGNNQGFDVEIARWFSFYAFGKRNRVTFECVTTPAREPALTTGRVDIVVATFTYTTDRDTRIDFSRPYYNATGRLLVRNNSPIRTLNDLRDKTVSTTTGSIYDRWVKRCFSQTKLVVVDSFTNAVLAFRDGRADAVMWDDSALLGIAVTDRNFKLASPSFLEAPYGIGIKQGDTAMKRWVDSRLDLMRKKDIFRKILRNTVPANVFASFSKNILRPKQTFKYAAADKSPETICP